MTPHPWQTVGYPSEDANAQRTLGVLIGIWLALVTTILIVQYTPLL
jgi:hypothetical protein